MKVALLTAQSRISPVFENTSTWLVINATPVACTIGELHHFKAKDENQMVNELLMENVEMIICGAVPFYIEKRLIDQGCEVFAFIAGDIDEVIAALNLNILDKPQFKMPGCQKRQQRGINASCKNAIHQ